MRTRLLTVIGLTIASMCQIAGAVPLGTELVGSGLVRPIWVTHAPGDTQRIFVIEKQGRIRIIKNGVLLPTAFLDIDALVTGGLSEGSEQGLLGLAFHPNYANNGLFYINYTATAGAGDTVVARYQVSNDPDVADPNSGVPILTFDQPQSNHNGGWLAFGPDGYLYIATGDGGSSNDAGAGHATGGNGQSLDTLLGKMLRINVDVVGAPYAIPPDNPFAGDIPGRDEIWAWGLRNPWRPSFDRLTGDLYIADVGQTAWEEINFQPARSTGGENYGWRCMEGLSCTGFTGCTCNAPTLTLPFHVYGHTGGNCSITGGYVYRGCAIPNLAGTYFFADYCTARIWSLRYDGVNVTQFVERTAQLDPPGDLDLNRITSFGEDANGELYICDQVDGEVFRLIRRGGNADLNRNGIADGCEGIPPCLADLTNDGLVDLADLGVLLQSYGFNANGDIDGDNDTDLADLGGFLQAFGQPCPTEPL